MVTSGAQAAVGTGVASNGLFQLDGNTLPGTCANPFPGTNAGQGDDWAALYNHVSELAPCGSDGFSFVADGVGSADNTYWSGGGSKDEYEPALGPRQMKPNDVSPDNDARVNAAPSVYYPAPTGPN